MPCLHSDFVLTVLTLNLESLSELVCWLAKQIDNSNR